MRAREEWAEALRRGEVVVNIPRTLAMVVALPALYGLGVGLFGPVHGVAMWQSQLPSTVAKLPTLVGLSFGFMLPAFFVAVRLGGLRLSAGSTLRLWLAAYGAFAAALGVLAPVTAVVSLTCNYSYTTLLNLAFLAAAGLRSVGFLLQSVRQLAESPARRDTTAGTPGRALRRPLLAFAVWSLAFACVGAEFGWRMRPLVGWRDVPFGWFRPEGEMTLWNGITSELYNIYVVGGL